MQYAVGGHSHKVLPPIGYGFTAPNGKAGVLFKSYNDPPSVKDRQSVEEINVRDVVMFLGDYRCSKLLSNEYYVDVIGLFTPEESGMYMFGLTVDGTAKLYVNGQMVVDNETVQRAGDSFFGSGTAEETGSIELKSGQTYEVKIEFGSAVTSKLVKLRGSTDFGGGGLLAGMAKIIDPLEEIEKAAAVAAKVDQVIICVGLNVSFYPEILSIFIDCNLYSLTGNLKDMTEKI